MLKARRKESQRPLWITMGSNNSKPTRKNTLAVDIFHEIRSLLTNPTYQNGLDTSSVVNTMRDILRLQGGKDVNIRVPVPIGSNEVPKQIEVIRGVVKKRQKTGDTKWGQKMSRRGVFLSSNSSPQKDESSRLQRQPDHDRCDFDETQECEYAIEEEDQEEIIGEITKLLSNS